MLRNSQI